jgi:hypothetical protein
MTRTVAQQSGARDYPTPARLPEWRLDYSTARARAAGDDCPHCGRSGSDTHHRGRCHARVARFRRVGTADPLDSRSGHCGAGSGGRAVLWSYAFVVQSPICQAGYECGHTSRNIRLANNPRKDHFAREFTDH